jgi:hypothetical protein
MEIKRYATLADWREEAVRRFGPDVSGWKFKCPVCGHVASVKDYKEAGAPEGATAFSCIGRYTGAVRDAFQKIQTPGPCNYTGGGLFKLNPVQIGEDDERLFEFAEPEEP